MYADRKSFTGGLVSYRTYSIDLSVLNANRVQIVPPGQQLGEVFSLTFPTGASMGLSFGQGDSITIDRPFSFAPDDPDTQQQGLFYTVPAAQPGVVVEIIVASAGATGALVGGP